jgi:hypothetical protein
VGIRCADHVTPLYPQKLALTSPNGGGRSVGIVRSRNKAMEFNSLYNYYQLLDILSVGSCAEILWCQYYECISKIFPPSLATLKS